MSEIEDVHALLDVVERTLIDFADIGAWEEIEVSDFPDFCLAVNDILGYGTAYGDPVAQRLAVSPAVLTKFAKFHGRVQARTARHLADRMRSYLRSLDQARPDPDTPVQQATAEPTAHAQTQVPAERSSVTFTAHEWKIVEATSEMGARIAAISALLDTIVVRIQRTNVPPEERAISEIERAQLIAILETALLMLKAPAIEKGLLARTREGLNTVAKKAAEKQVEQGLGNAASEASRQLLNLIRSIFGI